MRELDDDLNLLLEDDLNLFEEMKGKYVSEEERIFFETMKYKEEYELALMNDLLLVEADNEDDLYFIRIYADEYEIGFGATKKHFQSLKEALDMRLSDINMPAEFGTFGEWLRKRNYKGINYDGNINLH